MHGFLLVCGLLSVPGGHQVISHRVLVRGHEPTRHELRHRARSRPLRLAADAGWIVYCAAAVALGLVLR